MGLAMKRVLLAIGAVTLFVGALSPFVLSGYARYAACANSTDVDSCRMQAGWR